MLTCQMTSINEKKAEYMIKTYTFKTKDNSKNSFNFSNSASNADYSKILDNIITADLIKKNKYLFDCEDKHYPDTIGNNTIVFGAALKDDDEFIKAAKFLSNYKKNTFNLPKKFTYGKIYKLSDGTPIIFYDNEIQIGSDLYSYNDFNNTSFLNGLTSNTKKTIINIFTNGLNGIKINIFA